MAGEQKLFQQESLDAALRAQTEQIPELVNQVPKDQFMATTEEQLIEHLIPKMEVEPLQIYEDRIEMAQSEAKVDVTGWPDRNFWAEERRGPLLVPGIRVSITMPFTGDHELWKLRPNPCRMSFPSAKVVPPRGEQPGTLEFTITKPHDVPLGQFEQARDKFLDDVREHLKNQWAQIERFNNVLPQQMMAAVKDRRILLAKHEGLSELLGIPLKHREGAPPIQPIRVEKKITRPLPPPPKSGFKPEPGIVDEMFENILTVIRHGGRTYETTPKTYAVHDEEELRDIMLAQLNGHYEGGASGETFRKSGKTDIKIEDEDRAAFIAECAVWRGKKDLVGKIDQLLGYVTWRDCKISLIIFNKNVAGFVDLLEKVPDALTNHPLFVHDHGQKGDGEWRFVFRSPEDENRHFTVHVFLFDLYVK